MAGRKSTILNDLDAGERETIDAALASHRNEPVADIYRRFGLAQKEVSRRSFYAYARRFRSKMQKLGKAAGQTNIHADDINLSMLNEEQLFERMMRRVLIRGIERIDAGDTKGHEDAKFLAQTLRYQRLKIEEAAEARAEEIHQAKVEQLTKELREEVDKRSPNGESMGREEVYDLIDRVMRGEEAA